MLCTACGKELPIDSLHCPACGAAKTPAHGSSAAAGPGVADKIKNASKDSLQAFKAFALNPVGELANVFNSLGDARALAVGITFGVVSGLCFVLSFYLFFHKILSPGAMWYLKLFVYAFIPFVATAAASFAARQVFRGQGAVAVDAFISGAALLPFGFATILAAILGSSAPSLINFFFIVAGSLGVLILFFGFVRIAKISERASTLVVPLVVTLSGWLTGIVFKQLLGGGGNNWG